MTQSRSDPWFLLLIPGNYAFNRQTLKMTPQTYTTLKTITVKSHRVFFTPPHVSSLDVRMQQFYHDIAKTYVLNECVLRVRFTLKHNVMDVSH